MYQRSNLRSLNMTSSSCGLAVLAGIAVLVGLPAGCVTEPAATGPKAGPAVSKATDDCSDNMHDLAGYLLQHYVVHGEFPETLEALRPLVDLDRKLPLVCPVSGKPYLYYPTGLEAPGEKRRLVLFDPLPVHAGERWAIVATPAAGAAPVSLWVIRLDEATLKRYQPAPPQP